MKKEQEQKKESRFEEFKRQYGFNSGDIKWLPEGGELLKHVGHEVVMVEFNKVPDKDTYTSTLQNVNLIWIGDFDMMSLTYKVKWSPINKPEEVTEDRIIPEGFTFDIMGQGLQTGMRKFVPLSLHATIMEEDFYYRRLLDLWEKRDTLPFEALRALNESKEQDKTLRFAKNVVATVRPFKRESIVGDELDYEDEVFQFRVSRVKLYHEKGDIWRLHLSDQSGQVYVVYINPTEPDFKYHELSIGGEMIGDLKLIDLGDEKSIEEVSKTEGEGEKSEE